MKKRRSSAARVLVSVTLAVLFSLSIIAQSAGTLTGIVVDAQTGGPVRGATVVVEGTALKTTADINGLFALKVPPGTYRVAVAHATYGAQTLTDVSVVSGEENNLGVVLEPSGSGGEGESSMRLAESVTVTAQAISTEEASLVERRSANQISDRVSKEEISKATSSSAASVMQRVTGVTMVDDKYVYVRGLGERYSNTVLNGTAMPTTEPEKKVVPFDLFATSLLGKVSVLKSYSADRPGDFGAGIVEIETIDFPTRATMSISLGGTYDVGTTGDNFSTFAGGLSWSGSGGLALPASVPADKVVKGGLFSSGGFTSEEIRGFGSGFAGDWTPSSTNGPLGTNYSLTAGGTFGRLGVVISGSHNSGFDREGYEKNFYSLGNDGVLSARTAYDFEVNNESVRQGLAANFAYRLSANNQLKLQTFSTGLSSAEVRYVAGFNDDSGRDIEDTRLRYEDEDIRTGQLSGEHFIPGIAPSGSVVEWKISSSRGTREENLREVLYEEISPGRFLFADESQSGFALFSDLEDSSEEVGLNWTSFFTGPRVSGSVRTGALLVERDREFGSRRFRLALQPGFSVDLSRSPDELLTEQNIAAGIFELTEETRSTDSYTGEHQITAGYALGDVTMGRWRVIAGARLEQSRQDLVTFDQFALDAPPITTVNEDDDVLPSLSIIYQLTPSSNIRTAFSQTVNRPEFRELAPFEFTNIVGGRAVIGNPNLQRARITSYDLRWEWFPSSADVIAASVFYKAFEDPIESVLQSTAQKRESFANVDEARNYGFEVEFRRDLAFIRPYLRSLSLVSNYTKVDSEIQIGEIDLSVLTNTERPLVGQADQVFNATLEHNSERFGSVLRLLYNYTGEKISGAGSSGLPDIIEDPRSTIDAVWLQNLGRFAKGLTLRFAGRNLTESDVVHTQGGLIEQRLDPGREYSLSFGYQLF